MPQNETKKQPIFYKNIPWKTAVPNATAKFVAIFMLATTFVLFALVGYLHVSYEVHFLDSLYLIWLPFLFVLTLLLSVLSIKQITLSFTQLTFFLSLSILAMSGVMYHTGGIINPFIFLLLTPIALSVTILPWQAVLFLSGLTSLLFIFLTNFYVPVHSLKFENLNAFFYWYLTGSIATFLLLATFIVSIVLPLKRQSDAQQASLQQLKDEALHNEYLLSISAFSAATVHKIATPLNSISLLEGLIRKSVNKATYDEQILKDLDLMSSQVALCQSALKTLKEAVNKESLAKPLPLEKWFNDLFEEILLFHPNAKLNLATCPEIKIQVNHDFKMALLNLIDNALRASPNRVEIEIKHLKYKIDEYKTDELLISIIDHGQGIPKELLNNLGQTPLKESHGLGIGFFLSKSILNRYQTDLEILSSKKGATIQIKLPSDYIRTRT